MGETKYLTCLHETNEGFAFITVNAQDTVKIIARAYNIAIKDAWEMVRRYTYVNLTMGMRYPAGARIGEMVLPQAVTIRPMIYKVMNPTLAEKCRTFVEKGVEA